MSLTEAGELELLSDCRAALDELRVKHIDLAFAAAAEWEPAPCPPREVFP